MNIEAIILAGGKGTRLRSVTMNMIPKGLTPIQEKPILLWELEWLAREGIRSAILATGHLSEEIEKALGNQVETPYGTVDLQYSVEKEKLGSGGAVKLASELVSAEKTLILNGDVLTNAPLTPLFDLHKEKQVLATMLGVNMVSPYGIIHHKDNLIIKYEEKPRLDVPIHGGVDLFETDVLSRFPTKGQMEETIFVELVQERMFAFYLIPNDQFWMSIDTQKDFELANKTWTGLGNIV